MSDIAATLTLLYFGVLPGIYLCAIFIETMIACPLTRVNYAHAVLTILQVLLLKYEKAVG